MCAGDMTLIVEIDMTGRNPPQHQTGQDLASVLDNNQCICVAFRDNLINCETAAYQSVVYEAVRGDAPQSTKVAANHSGQRCFISVFVQQSGQIDRIERVVVRHIVARTCYRIEKVLKNAYGEIVP